MDLINYFIEYLYMSDIKLIYAGDKNNKAKNISEYILSGKTGNNDDVKEYYQGSTDIDSIIELLLLTKRLSEDKRKIIVDSTLHQNKVFGHINSGEGKGDVVAIITKDGHIKYIDDEKDEKEKLSALYEPFISKINVENFSTEDVVPVNENANAKKKSYLKRLDDKFTMSLKKLKPSTKLNTINNYKKEHIVGQIVDPTKKILKGIIIKSDRYKQQLVLINDAEVIKGIPVFAILSTK